MPFQKGKRHPNQGGKRGGGRPSKHKKEVKVEAAKLAQAFIEAHVKPVLEAYSQLAAGRKVNHYSTEDGRLLWTEVEVDSPTLRHYIDKLVPSPKLAPTDKAGNTIPTIVYVHPSLEDDCSDGDTK